MSLRRRLDRWLDRLTLYLPLAVLGLLAMGSWWLVRSIPVLLHSPASPPVRKEPDYHLEKFVTNSFDVQGRLVQQLHGEKARHYLDTDELHIDNVRFESVSEQGIRVRATALRGIATGDGERVTLTDQVVVHRQSAAPAPELELRGQRMVAWREQEIMRSDEPVEIVRGMDRFWAQTMVLNMKTGQYQLVGQVRGVLAPRIQP